MYHKYIAATVAYGVGRKVVTLSKYDSYERPDYNKFNNERKEFEKRKVPLLTTEKLGIIALGGVSSIFWWPLQLIRDLNKIEIAMRGLQDDDAFSTNLKPTYFLDFVVD